MMLLALPAIASPDAPVLPGWWPVPPGWWLLGLAIFLGLLWAAYLFFRQFLMVVKARQRRVPPIRMRALAALDELAHRRPLAACEAAYRLNEILRAALFDAGSDTAQWPFPVLDGVIEDQDAWEYFWRQLEMRYQPAMGAGEEDVERWLMLANGWVTHLPVGDADMMKGP